MLKMNYDLQDALANYLELLHLERYFDAHEVLEEAWHPLRLSNDKLRHPVKGLINVAIAFEHIKRGKDGAYNKAQRVLSAYERHKSSCQESKILAHICKEVDRLRATKGI